MDLWVMPTKENYDRMIRAFKTFGLPTTSISKEMFLAVDQYDVFSFGRPLVSINIMTTVKGLDFNRANQISKWHILADGFRVRVIHLNDLIKTKKVVGRYKDLADVEALLLLQQEDE